MNHHVHTGSGWTALIPTLLIMLIALAYGLAVKKTQKKNLRWELYKTGAFVVGLGLLLIAFLPSIAHWAHQDLRGHMVQHLLIGMFAPVFLVLGQPLTLAMKASSVRFGRLLTVFLRHEVVYWISHPITALVLNIGVMYLLYLTPLYSMALTNPMLHHLIHIHFFVAGFVFAWSIMGSDPVPRRPGFGLRLGVLFISMATHAYLSKLMYAHLFPRNTHHTIMEIQEASKLMYYWGDLAELLLAIGLFYLWYQKRKNAHIITETN
jgi:putative membrane protein